jgi:hypothetical protein
VPGRGRGTPSTATVLGVLGMIAYPICAAGLSWTVGQTLHPVAGWAVALILAAVAGLPKLHRDLEHKHELADQQTYAGRADPPVIAALPAPTYGPPSNGAGPAVAAPWRDVEPDA